MKFSVIAGVVFAVVSVSASASNVSKDDLKSEMVGLYPQANLTQEMVTDFAPGNEMMTCEMIGYFSSSLTRFVADVTSASDQAGASVVNLAKEADIVTHNLSDFCGGSPTLAAGKKQAALDQLATIKQKLDGIWKALFGAV